MPEHAFEAVEMPAPTPVTYDAETPAQKQTRRERVWTPVTDFA